jgi:hypothetical protein
MKFAIFNDTLRRASADRSAPGAGSGSCRRAGGATGEPNMSEQSVVVLHSSHRLILRDRLHPKGWRIVQAVNRREVPQVKTEQMLCSNKNNINMSFSCIRLNLSKMHYLQISEMN